MKTKTKTALKKSLQIAIATAALMAAAPASAGVIPNHDLYLVSGLCGSWDNYRCRERLDVCYAAYRSSPDRDGQIQVCLGGYR